MNRDETINYILDTGFVEKYVTKLVGYYEPDFIQDIWLQILEIPESKWKLLWTQPNFSPIAFVSGLIYRNIKSSSSPIYYKYKKRANHEHFKTDKEWSVLENQLFIKSEWDI